jgi:hypothetical protein
MDYYHYLLLKMLPQVELRAARIPYIGMIAVHYWFVIKISDISERWEIWQSQNQGKICWGHLHLNLMPIHQGVGNGGSWVEQIWEGEKADKLIKIIRQSPDNYQYNYLYRYYPGPNSNTYVQWILDQGKIDYTLSHKGIGKNYGQWKNWWRKLLF